MNASEANKAKCRRYREANREKYLESHRVWRANNREKLLAQGKTRRAVKYGRLIKLPCEVCGNVQSEAHHPDYSKPLDVRWLCTLHHKNEHRKPHCSGTANRSRKQ